MGLKASVNASAADVHYDAGRELLDTQAGLEPVLQQITRYLIAIAFGGEPTPPMRFKGFAVNMKS